MQTLLDPGPTTDGHSDTARRAPGTVRAGDPRRPGAGAHRPTVWRRAVADPRFWVAAPLLSLFTAFAAVPGAFARRDLQACDLSRSLEGPQRGHPFGFDLLGCDHYTRTIYGARSSLTIAVTVVAVALLVALVLGAVAALRGGAVDTVISRATDVAFGVPLVLGGLVVLAVQDQRGIPQVAAVLAALSWPAMLRLMRIAVITQLQAAYVEAARALGASGWRIVLRHVLAGAVGPVLVYATALTGAIVAAEATLSFMGVGLQLPAISWGLQLAAAQHHIGQAPHLLIPGAFVMLAVLGFVLVGEALRDALDPRTGRG